MLVNYNRVFPVGLIWPPSGGRFYSRIHFSVVTIGGDGVTIGAE